MKQHNLLIVDDDKDMRDALKEQLELYDEFILLEANNAAQGIKIAQETQIDLVIIDVMLPDMDGREAIKILRKNGVETPIIILTAQNTDADTILGLESGANDYITKPFKISVFIARIRTQLRQFEQSENAVLNIGEYNFYPAQKILKDKKNKEIRLTEKETAILKYLYKAKQQCVTRKEILQDVWGYNTNVTTHTLETHIYRLRQKMESEPTHSQIIHTCPGGYKLINH